MKNFFVKTYGCQYNEWDSVRLNYLLSKLGFVPSGEKEADIIFVIACAVRQTAVDRILGKIKNWKNKKVIISGCILDIDKKKLKGKGITLWDINNPDDLPSILGIKIKNIEKLLREGQSLSCYLPIMTGCNNFCAYCAVPYTKGRETSRPFDEVVAEFKKLVDKGFKEIMLLGQNVNSYSGGFAKLLKTLNDIPGDFRISFTSNHPKDMTEEVVKTIRDCEKVINQIHLPLQSGSNKILKAMNRPYTREKYLEIVSMIKQIIPEVEITTDVIVGFPGESEKDFEQTVDIYKKVGYFQSFTNKYSPRAGTAAYKLGDPISWHEKQRRWRILNDLANKK